MPGGDAVVPVGAHGDGEQGVDNDGGDRVAGENGDEEPADQAEPFLHKDPAVQQHEGDASQRVAGGVEEIEGVIDLLARQELYK